MSYYQRHVFFCCNQRPPGDRTCCNDKGATAMRDYAKKKVKSLGLAGPGKVRINQSGCLDRCELGPCVVVYPEGVWYTYVDEEDIDEIIAEHVQNGRVVERLEAQVVIRDVLKMGDVRLLGVAEPVRDFGGAALGELIDDMFDTMRSLDGAGLAAPQIGVPLRVVIFGFDASARYPDALPVPQTVLINPVLTPLSDEKEEGWEGCLSVPGLRGKVPRWRRLRYTGFDQHGKPIDRSVDDFHARVVQHEVDHLDGVLYPMRITDLRSFGFNEVLFPGQDLSDD